MSTLASDADRLAAYSRASTLRAHESRLLVLAQRALVLQREALQRENAYDFDRLIVATRDLLRDHADVRRAVQRQIRLLVVDEFQDVDPAQRDLAFLLSGLDTDERGSRLLLVGDPKQSIFRFRRADVTLWNGVAARFSNRPRDGVSWRCPTTSGVNRAYSRWSTRFLVNSSIRPFRPSWGDSRSRSTTRRLLRARGTRPATSVSNSSSSRPATMASCSVPAMCARSKHRRSQRAFVRSSTVGRTYGEMAILLSGWGSVETYADALRLAGIPAYVLRSEGFWETREILDCLLALRAIRDGGTSAHGEVPGSHGARGMALVAVRRRA